MMTLGSYSDDPAALDFDTTAVVRIEDGIGPILFFGDPDSDGPARCEMGNLPPERQAGIMRDAGKTHVFCDTHWDRGMYTIDGYVSLLRSRS